MVSEIRVGGGLGELRTAIAVAVGHRHARSSGNSDAT